MADIANINTLISPLRLEKEIKNHLDIPAGVRTEGWVYVLTNPFMPGIYKIGMTTNEPEGRANQISQGTGIPAPFEVNEAYFSNDPKRDELEIHEYLAEFRINPAREFFECSLDDISKAFEACGLVRRSASAEELADNFHVISFERADPFSLQELFDELGISVFGCKYAATRRLIEVAKTYLNHLQKEGCSVVFDGGKAIPIVKEIVQQRDSFFEARNKAGAYGPQQPRNF